MRRVAATEFNMLNSITSTLLWFNTMIPLENVHPLEGGMFRMKFRRDRRSDLPIESPLVFYPRLLKELVVKAKGYWSIYRRLTAIKRAVASAPDRYSYSDLAIAPLRENEIESLDLFHATRGGEDALARKRRDDAIRAHTDHKAPAIAPV